ncbi:uroporphyrinogen-III synthase [Actinotalea sp. M2MS4P-6]|nr:uroporphyrinogen-III synthase [Actinotalea sp. M2MS4P-6]MCV2392903.1 uroporphyrinogen-III synthase [Actinotalea sp. M2MS4P-6]
MARALLDRGAGDLVTAAHGALAGWRVLVPRAGEWADKVGALLAAHGARAVAVPLIEFSPPDDLRPLDAALDRLAEGRYDWLAVTSATTAAALAARVAARARAADGSSPERAQALRDQAVRDLAVRDLAGAVGQTRVAAVGPATAAALEGFGVTVSLVPTIHSAAGLVAKAPGAPARYLVPHSDLADATLADGLRARGVEVDEVVAYRTVAGPPVAPQIRADLEAGRINAVLLSSPSTVTQLIERVGLPPAGTVVACIGPRTARAAQEAGLTVHVQPASSSTEALVHALVQHVREAS